jgi:D-alanyl-D-alanine carboxypeptidase/D-alanyl-D-alanine-endopeptidase (penicillin-binding protein 4)
MPQGDGRRLRRSTGGLVLLVLVAALASYQFDLGSRWFGLGPPSPITEPAQVLPPPGLKLPGARQAAPVAQPTQEQAVDAAAVRRALAPLVGAKKLGRHVVVEVARLSDAKAVYRYGGGQVTPASTMKMLTTVAALHAVGPQHRFTTKVVATPQSKRIVLVGGGDPLLASRHSADYPAGADLDTLARSTAKALKRIGRSRVTLGYDASLFTGPSVNPKWEPTYIPEDVVSPISALWVDEGREHPGLAFRTRSPASQAAQVFADALARHHIKVQGSPVSARAPSRSHGGESIARVRSAPLAEIVQHTLELSDNEAAEVLSRQVAVATQRPASFTGGVQAVRSVLRGLGVPMAGDRMYDGSGLSRDNRLTAHTLLSVLRVAAGPGNRDVRPAVASLPVAGFTGSLRNRFATASVLGRGTVRAKTGTLTGVHGLTGIVTSPDGAVMSFVAIADKVKPVNTLFALTRIDAMAAALGACVCAKGG